MGEKTSDRFDHGAVGCSGACGAGGNRWGCWARRTGELGELSEGVAVDKTGNVFVSLAALGQLLKFAPGSSDF